MLITIVRIKSVSLTKKVYDEDSQDKHHLTLDLETEYDGTVSIVLSSPDPLPLSIQEGNEYLDIPAFLRRQLA